MDVLAKRGEQYRAIQRRLLAKMRDKTPEPLANLDALLENSLSQLMQLADIVEEQRAHLQFASSAFSTASRLVCDLLEKSSTSVAGSALKLVLSDQQLGSGLQSSVDCSLGGLEEIYEASISHFMKHSMSSQVFFVVVPLSG